MNSGRKTSDKGDDYDEQTQNKKKQKEQLGVSESDEDTEHEIEDGEIEENTKDETQENELEYEDEEADSALEDDETSNGNDETEGDEEIESDEEMDGYEDDHSSSQEGVPLEIDEEKRAKKLESKTNMRAKNKIIYDNFTSTSSPNSISKTSPLNKTVKTDVAKRKGDGNNKTVPTTEASVVRNLASKQPNVTVIPKLLRHNSSVIDMEPRNLVIPSKSRNSVAQQELISIPERPANLVNPIISNTPVHTFQQETEHVHTYVGPVPNGQRSAGAVMGPGNWQARNWFSSGRLRKDGVRWLGRCCGDECRNGGVGCCGKCPRCIDCPYKK